jgi:hypothetical protein
VILVRFIADGSFVSRAIGWRTEGKISHVEYITTNDSGVAVDTFGARLDGGICHRPYDYCSPTFEEWYSFEGIEASYAEALKLDNRNYDWKNIIRLLFGEVPDSFDPQETICSVLVGYSNRMAWAAGTAPALINPNVPTSEITPELLYGAVSNMVKKVL